MTDSNGEWKPFPDARDYEASHRGKVQSLDRTKNGRFHKGIVLKLREDGDGYLVFNYTDDENVRHHNVSVARMVLLAHDPDGYFEGAQACHGPGGQKDNRGRRTCAGTRPTRTVRRRWRRGWSVTRRSLRSRRRYARAARKSTATGAATVTSAWCSSASRPRGCAPLA